MTGTTVIALKTFESQSLPPIPKLLKVGDREATDAGRPLQRNQSKILNYQ
jgi:hypothetical protein